MGECELRAERGMAAKCGLAPAPGVAAPTPLLLVVDGAPKNLSASSSWKNEIGPPGGRDCMSAERGE